MELNKIARREINNIVNEGGSIVIERIPEIQLYLEASNFKIKTDDFYKSNDDKIKSLIDKTQKCQYEYVLGLSKFLSDCGMKTSPVVMLSRLSHAGGHFGTVDIDTKKKFMQIFNTPQRIAEAIGLQNHGYLHLNSSFKKCVLRNALENMTPYTLQKNKMNNRKIKVKDLIKYLRPQPVIPERSMLYKHLIEDGSMSKLPQDKKTLIQVKSDVTMSNSEKMEYYNNNITTIPLNMLIRNLKFISENSDFRTQTNLQIKILNRLESIEDKDMRFLNVFDLIEVAIHVPAFEKVMFEVIKGFVQDMKTKFNYNNAEGTILFDFSGSMEGEAFELGFKYLVLMSLLFDEVDLYCFSDRLHESNLNGQPFDIKKGNISRAHNDMHSYFRRLSGGTALLGSVGRLLEIDYNIKNLVVISDEVSWVEGDNLLTDITDISRQLKNIFTILINPKVSCGTVFKNNMIGFSGISSNVLYNIMMGSNHQEFINFIKNY